MCGGWREGRERLERQARKVGERGCEGQKEGVREKKGWRERVRGGGLKREKEG